MGGSGGLPSGKGGGKRQLLRLEDVDGRTRAYKRAIELKAGFLSDLGGEDHATVAQRELAQRGAVTGAMLEDQEAKWLAGTPVELDPVAHQKKGRRPKPTRP